jgi:uncharacterized membrane protein YqjE
MSIFKDYFFYVALVAFAGFVIRYFAPQFPLTDAQLLELVLFVLAACGWKIERALRAQGFRF